jgi:hypothetical protein
MLFDLLHLDVRGFVPQDFPKTDALLEQKLASLHAPESWWYSVLVDGQIGEYEWDAARDVEFQELKEAFQVVKGPTKMTAVKFKNTVQKMLPDWQLCPENGCSRSGQNRVWNLPKLSFARAQFNKWIGHEAFKTIT